MKGLEKKMTNRENVLNVLRRKGYTKAVPFFELCPQLVDLCEQETGRRDYNEYFNISIRMLDIWHLENSEKKFGKLFDYNYNEGTYFDKWGVGFEPGSKEAFHMTRFLHPLKKCLSLIYIAIN